MGIQQIFILNYCTLISEFITNYRDFEMANDEICETSQSIAQSARILYSVMIPLGRLFTIKSKMQKWSARERNGGACYGRLCHDV